MSVPTITGHTTFTHTGGTSATFSLTAAASELVLVAVSAEKSSSAGFTLSINGGGVVWAERSVVSSQVSISAGSTAFVTTNVFYAEIASNITAQPVTITSTGTIDDLAGGYVRVQPTNGPFDPNITLPGTAISNASTPHPSITISTTNVNDLVFTVMGAPFNSISTGVVMSTGTITNLFSITNTGGGLFSTCFFGFGTYVAAETGLIANYPTQSGVAYILDAITDTITPGVPTGLTVGNATSSSLTASWTVGSGPAPTSYTLQYRVDPAGSWVQITGIPAATTTYTVTGLLPNTFYDFEVEAVNTSGNSGFSGEVTASTVGNNNFGPIPVFPSLPKGFPINVSPNFDTTVGTTKSLREMRVPQRLVPLWDIEILFEELLDQTQNQSPYVPFLGDQEYEDLVQLWLMMYGQANVFAFDAPWDNSRSNQTIGIGDGSTYIFTIYRTWATGANATLASIGAINTVTQVQVNGVTVPSSNYSVERNKITFQDSGGTQHPPGSGLAITMTFSFYYLCQFVEDEQDFEEFAKNRWKVPSLKFTSVNWP